MAAERDVAPGADAPRGQQAGLLSTSRALYLPAGKNARGDHLHGYHIDFREKARTAQWPPGRPVPGLHVVIAQAGLGSFERFVSGEGDQWLEGAIEVAEHLVRTQSGGGGWVHDIDLPHTYEIRAPWLSAMAQGEGASLLARVASATGEERFREAALRALGPFSVDVSRGGVRRRLGGGPFLEEYPTQPGSYVLNGAIFAVWGLLDVALLEGDRELRQRFEDHVHTIAANIGRWDTGGWSRYDLFPHVLTNVASSFYHSLHINMLEALHRSSPFPELAVAQATFEGYARQKRLRRRAFAAKVAFRLTVPRSARSPQALVKRFGGR